MYQSLVLSIQILQNSKYGKGNKKKFNIIQSALKQANPLFVLTNEQNNGNEPKSNTLINFRNIAQQEQIPKIVEEFANDFEIQCLSKNGSSAKNYSLFSVTLLKIIKTLNDDKRRGLLSAHAINILNRMFAKYPVEYSKRAIKDPLGLIFVMIELAIDVERHLSTQYEFDVISLRQLVPLIQRYHMEFDNALLEIINEFKKMPKFRLTVSIGERHEAIVKKFLQFGIAQLSLENRIIRSQNILEKIINEKNDSIALQHYNMLKLCYDDAEIRPHLSKIAKQKKRSERRFANTILDEISNF